MPRPWPRLAPPLPRQGESGRRVPGGGTARCPSGPPSSPSPLLPSSRASCASCARARAAAASAQVPAAAVALQVGAALRPRRPPEPVSAALGLRPPHAGRPGAAGRSPPNGDATLAEAWAVGASALGQSRSPVRAFGPHSCRVHANFGAHFCQASGCQERRAAPAPGRGWRRPLQDEPPTPPWGPRCSASGAPGSFRAPGVRGRCGMTGMAGAMAPASRTNQEVLRSEA